MEQGALAKRSSPQAGLLHSVNSRVSAEALSVIANDLDFSEFQRAFGDQAMLALLASELIQATLRGSRPGDSGDAEADRHAFLPRAQLSHRHG